MPHWTAIKGRLEKLCSDWNKAEMAIKLAEQVNGKIVDPAIYELRYGARRMVEAFSLLEAEPETAKKLLDDAMFDCCRARHDAIDAATSKVAADMLIHGGKVAPRDSHVLVRLIHKAGNADCGC